MRLKSLSQIWFPLSNKNKLRIPSTGVDPTAPFSGRAYGHGHSGSGYGGGYGGHGGGGGGYGHDQLVLLRPPVQDDGGGLNRLKRYFIIVTLDTSSYAVFNVMETYFK